jgi:two-component system phosphate regulon sensor histidine kinase PhoR
MPAKKAASDLLEETLFLRLIDDSLKNRSEVSLIVLHSVRLEEIRTSRGPDMAVQVMERLIDFVSALLQPAEQLGRLGPDYLAVLLTAPLPAAQERAKALQQSVTRHSRLPVSVGISNSAGLKEGAQDLCRLAFEAAAETWAEGARQISARTAAGPVKPPETAASSAPAPSASLQDRYQRLVLLNRMSLELFSDRPFPEALAAASNVILALLDAPYTAIYFCDDFGSPYAANRHGDPLFLEAQAEEALVAAQALSERRIMTAQGTRLGWVATPLSRVALNDPGQDGVLVVGYPQPRAPSPEKDQTMVEICRLLHNARLIQRNLQQQRVLAAVTEQSADAIMITDLASRVLLWNTSLERLSGYSKNDLLGSRAEDLVPNDHREELYRYEDETRETGSVRFESVRQRKDHSLVPVECNYTLLKDDKGTPWGMVRVFRDITKRKELDRMKSEFVSLVSHELRTPLTAIQGFTETILDFGDELEPEKRIHYMKVILEEAKRLGRLVTNFLDISKLEAGAIEPKPQVIELEALCARLATLFKDHPSKAVFETRFEPLATKVWADEDQVYRVLVNLCGNALKYTPAGGKVTISSKPSANRVEICVEDQGPGISKENLGRIFEKFFRVADTVSKKTTGTGLGLAISKGIVEAHGGRMWVESEFGHGTRFLFTLPAQP